jgi:hypothetical protein
MATRANTGMRLMESSIAKLDGAGDRMGGKSRAFVVEVLIALYADKLTAETQIPVGFMPSGSRKARRTSGELTAKGKTSAAKSATTPRKKN